MLVYNLPVLTYAPRLLKPSLLAGSRVCGGVPRPDVYERLVGYAA